MAKRLFVGNLPYTADDARLKELFEALGTVVAANVITNKYTGRSKGFGFVEMSTDEEADKAIAELNGKDVDGRAVVVSEARPRTEESGENRPAQPQESAPEPAVAEEGEKAKGDAGEGDQDQTDSTAA